MVAQLVTFAAFGEILVAEIEHRSENGGATFDPDPRSSR